MSVTIRPLAEANFHEYVTIVGEAFPGMDVLDPSGIASFTNGMRKLLNDKRCQLFGAYEGSRLVGGMNNIDFEMTALDQTVGCGGLGFVVVSLADKKRGIAKALVQYHLKHWHDRDYAFSSLWSFRPDFYRQMGYGYGAKGYLYEFLTSAFPDSGDASHIRKVESEDLVALTEFYNGIAARTNGMFASRVEHWQFSREWSPKARTYAYFEDNNTIRGFCRFRFESLGEQMSHDARVLQLQYDSPEVLAAFCTFFRRQADQLRRIRLTSYDPNLEYLVGDPRDATGEVFPMVFHRAGIHGVGIMYRILDTEKIWTHLAGHNFNDETVTLAITTTDTLTAWNNRAVVVRFESGTPQVVRNVDIDCELRIDLGDLASLLLGSVDIETLHRYSRIRVSDPTRLDQLNRLFAVPQPPVNDIGF